MSAVQTQLEPLVDDFCAAEWSAHPVDASFIGATGYDAMLPPAGANARMQERERLWALSARLDGTALADDAGGRLDAKLMRAQLDYRLRCIAERPLQANPAWFTGEVAFGIVSLLLPSAVEREPAALAARVHAIPDFLASARTFLRERPIPADWTQRARTEVAAIVRLLDESLARHSFGGAVTSAERSAAKAALREFDRSLAGADDTSAAAGRDFLAFMIANVHGLPHTPESLEHAAQSAFETALAELEETAARLDSSQSWRDQLAQLARRGPQRADDIPATYETWHERAMSKAAALLTPAADYALDFRYLPAWAQPVASELYFLFYRSPAPLWPGSGSVYWVAPLDRATETAEAHSTAAVKLVHAVHHGSIGHHTQNARARTATSRLARLAGTDCASGLAYPSAGTMVEGWACYAENLMAESADFYTAAERLQLAYFDLRNIATTLADIRFHTGAWSLAEMRAFYRDEVHFAPARIWPETTRNSMFPGSRLMYWTGTQQIVDLRKASRLPVRQFHDRLLSFGSAPVAWIAQEFAADVPA